MRLVDRATVVAAVAVACLVGLSIRFATFVPWGTDSAGYVESAHRWADGGLFAPSPIQLWSRWNDTGLLISPLAFRPGALPATEVSVYPLGLPVITAAALKIGGAQAPYLVSPAFMALLAWCTFIIARQLAGPWSGAVAAILVSASPVTLLHAVTPMSDVPVTALWALAWMLSLRVGFPAACAAGASVALAIMVRPNLAPFAVIVGACLWVAGRSDQRSGDHARLIVFASVAAIGPAMMAWSQSVLYGSAWTPGYIGWETFFSRDHIPANAAMYVRFLFTVHTPLALLGLATTGVLWRSRPAGSRLITATAVAFVFLNYLLYLPYLSYDDLPFLRFMLPALTALFVLLAAGVVHLAGVIGARTRAGAVLMFIPIIIVIGYPWPFVRYAFGLHVEQARVNVMGRYLAEILPANAAVLTGLQGGAVAHYTGRQIFRVDLIDPPLLDEVVQKLTRRGYRPVFVVDEAMEMPFLRERFKTSHFGKLDWPPRARLGAPTAMVYFDAADVDRYRRGERWVIDVVE